MAGCPACRTSLWGTGRDNFFVCATAIPLMFIPADTVVSQNTDQVDKTLLFALLPVLVAFSFMVFVFYRAKREAFFKQKEAEFRLNKAELEMKALRSQINPHFIFNCLNSIHHYMHRSDVATAGEYLVKFSKLIRYTLETSSFHTVSLNDDLQALEIYIQLERLRLNNSFDYRLTVSDEIDAESLQVPPMLIQPFVENSIWHGLNHRGADGKIEIEIRKLDNMLTCVIEDNGMEGNEKDSFDLSYSVKKTSIGMSLVNERLALINRLFEVQSKYQLEDKPNLPGKRLTLIMPYEE